MPPRNQKTAVEPRLRILKREEFVKHGSKCTVFRDTAERLTEERERQPVNRLVVKMAFDWTTVNEQAACSHVSHAAFEQKGEDD